jgi:small subunit ribosomal protein S20
MANHVSAKKRAQQNVKQAKINSAGRNRIRTFVKKVEEAIAAGDSQAAEAALREAQPVLQRGISKGIIEKKAAARKISRLSSRIKSVKTAPKKD